MHDINKDDIVVLSTDQVIRADYREKLAEILKEMGMNSIVLESGLKIEGVIRASK